jgi:hypothetical protein
MTKSVLRGLTKKKKKGNSQGRRGAKIYLVKLSKAGRNGKRESSRRYEKRLRMAALVPGYLHLQS